MHVYVFSFYLQQNRRPERTFFRMQKGPQPIEKAIYALGFGL